MAIDDVRAALEWVQDNIQSFGGNPKNVTLAGFSAGGNMVSWQAILQAQRMNDWNIHKSGPMPRELFHRLYMMSGLYSIIPERTLEEARSDTRTIASLTGLDDIVDLDHARNLRGNIDAHKLQNRIKEHFSKSSTHKALTNYIRDKHKENMFRPVIDGHTIRKSGRAYIEAGCWPKVRTVLTTTAQDGSIFAKPALDALTGEQRKKAFVAEVAYSIKPDVVADGVFKQYHLGDTKISSKITEIIIDVMFRCPALHMVDKLQSQGIDIWYGEHQFSFNLLDLFKPHMGSFHSIDQMLSFGSMALHVGAPQSIAMMTMQNRFSKFLYDGNLLETLSGEEVLWLHRGGSLMNTIRDQKTRCEFWLKSHKDDTPISLVAADMALPKEGDKVDGVPKAVSKAILDGQEPESNFSVTDALKEALKEGFSTTVVDPDLSEARKKEIGIVASPGEDEIWRRIGLGESETMGVNDRKNSA